MAEVNESILLALILSLREMSVYDEIVSDDSETERSDVVGYCLT